MGRGRGEEERREGEMRKGRWGRERCRGERERGMGGHSNPTPLISPRRETEGVGRAKRGEGREKRRKRGWNS